MNPIFIQTISYGIVLLIAIAALSMIQRGFFWKYIRVRLSFGKYLLVKVRSVNRDYFRVGRIDDGMLLFKGQKDDKRLFIQNTAIYKSMAVSWVDVDEITNGVREHDFSAVSGFDAEKYNSLYVRALYRPSVMDKKEALIILLIIVAIIAAVASAYLTFRNSADISTVAQQLTTIQSTVTVATP